MSKRRRRKIEMTTKYFHALLESDDDGDLLTSQNDWQGGLNALRRDLQQDQVENNEANQRALEHMRNELNSNIAALQKQMTSMLEDLKDEIQEIKKIQPQGGVTFDGRRVATAVKVVKSIGKQGAFWNNNDT
jgi:peptidoglycan hydrolase CwlO-like protein